MTAQTVQTSALVDESKPRTRGKAQPRAIVYIEPLYLAKPDAAAFLSVSESTLDNLVQKKKIKPPRKISENRSGYLVADLREYGENLPASDLLPPRNSGYGRAGKPAA